jgi:rhodanese-related sulfurtransferase
MKEMKATAPTRVTPEEVIERMQRGEEIAFVDTRNPTTWTESDSKLPHAIRIPHDEVDKHLDELPSNRTIITYCT